MSPSVPPPPYEEIARPLERLSISSSRPPVHSSRSEQSVPRSQPHRLRKKASAWMSSVDLGRHHRNGRSSEVLLTGHGSSLDLSRSDSAPAASDGILAQSMNQSAAMCDQVAARLTEVFSRHEADEAEHALTAATATTARHDYADDTRPGLIDFKKTWLYANSRLPPHMLPMKLYLDTWRLVCLAATASLDAYRRPRVDEREDFIAADWRRGTKAMCVKTRAVDDLNCIVLAVRGSRANLIDWSVNFGLRPTDPAGFLGGDGDIAANPCHAGFLHVARQTVVPVAARLVELLNQHAARRGLDTSPPSLLLTGHSAGGAVASLLYVHMVSAFASSSSSSSSSALRDLAPFFRRVHCVTFGTPPLSLLPLQKPSGPRLSHSLFYTFANEGDVVVRADRTYLGTIARLLAAPAPVRVKSPSSGNVTSSRGRAPVKKKQGAEGGTGMTQVAAPWWEVPPATLSLPGTVMVLREQPGHAPRVEAVRVTDEDLRKVVFGDPAMHAMELYRRRIDELAAAAITGHATGIK